MVGSFADDGFVDELLDDEVLLEDEALSSSLQFSLRY